MALKFNTPQTPHGTLAPPPLQDFPAVAVGVEFSIRFHWRVKAADHLFSPVFSVLSGKSTRVSLLNTTVPAPHSRKCATYSTGIGPTVHSSSK